MTMKGEILGTTSSMELVIDTQREYKQRRRAMSLFLVTTPRRQNLSQSYSQTKNFVFGTCQSDLTHLEMLNLKTTKN